MDHSAALGKNKCWVYGRNIAL